MNGKLFKSRFQVRGYELDGYGHVNHAVYLNYMEYARWCMIEESGSGGNYFASHGLTPVIVKAEVNYRAPCFLAEWLFVETRMIELRKKTAVFEQLIYKEKDKVLASEGRVTLCAIGNDGKAKELPSDFGTFYGAV